MKPYAGGKDGCLQHLSEQSFSTARCATVTTAGGENARLGGPGCGVSCDLGGMITGVVPVRACEVAHELHVKCLDSPTKSGVPMLSNLAMQHQIFDSTDMSR